jgi:hypothetical protein
VPRVLSAQQDRRALLALLELSEQQVLQVRKVPLVLRVHKAYPGPTERRAQQDQ